MLIAGGACGLVVCCCALGLVCSCMRSTKRDDKKALLVSARDISMSDVFQRQDSRRGSVGASPMRATNRHALV